VHSEDTYEIFSSPDIRMGS